MMADLSRTDVMSIFDPLIKDIQRLVEEQVNLVTVKRLSEGHPKGDQIKVCETSNSLASSAI